MDSSRGNTCASVNDIIVRIKLNCLLIVYMLLVNFNIADSSDLRKSAKSEVRRMNLMKVRKIRGLRNEF